ncbi:hypothetical protein [Xanthocytophaga agilis]|uniref:Uncharacterized protein n=1 Tax=Xanthocytophaga agilis TaxID=3048010 RepID=A0AAE3R5H8_9BACT|nr:hypothetical protein [Xanthocytophaga agilis]MDJ1501067.1 hypothetical protein [Xanthocytophaga agilis]
MIVQKGFIYPVILFITSATFVFYYFHQPIASYTKAPLMDGNQYIKIYYYLTGKVQNYEVAFPFHSRIAIPWLASLLPVATPVIAFQIVNLIFSLSSVCILTYYWQKITIRPYLIRWGIFWLLFHWTGLIRLNAYDPITVDVPLYFFQTLLLLLLYNRNWIHLWWLAPLATIQKESFPALLIVLVIYGILYNKSTHSKTFPTPIIAGSLFISLILKCVIEQSFPPSTPGNPVITILYFIKQSLIDPFRIIRWLTGVWVAFGGIVWLAIWQWWKDGNWHYIQKSVWQRKYSLPLFRDFHTDLLFLFSVTYLGLSLLAGGDFTRIVFLGYPFIMTYLFVLLKNTNPKLSFVILLLSLPLMHLHLFIPDQGLYWTQFVEWYPEFAPSSTVWLMFGYGMLIGLSSWILLKFQVFQQK